MTDQPQGHGWWQAADLKWYPPELHADYAAPPTPVTPDEQTQQPPPGQPPGDGPGPGWWQAADLKWYPPELHADYAPADLHFAATQQRPPGGPPVPSPEPADRPPTEIGTPAAPEGQRPPRSLKWPLVALGVILVVVGFLFWRPMAYLGLIVLTIGLVLMAMGQPGRLKWPPIVAIVVVLAAVVGITGYHLWAANRAQPAPSGPTAQPAYGPQVTLPFTAVSGFRFESVAVDTAGNVYVIDRDQSGAGKSRVLKLAPGSNTPTVVPFTGINDPFLVAVDPAGNVYAVEWGGDVVKLAADSATQSVLPHTGTPGGVAVDTGGNVYYTYPNGVGKLTAGTGAQNEPLPFTGLNNPAGVAVDSAGNFYVVDGLNNRVVKLAAGSGAETELPFTGLNHPRDVAVDSAGNLYVTDALNNRVVKLAAASGAQTVLPFTFTRLGLPQDGVAVDTAGSVYVSDGHQVFELPAG